MITLHHTTASAVREHAAWAATHILVLGILNSTVGLGPGGWIAGMAYTVATVALVAGALARSGGRLGPADRVTLGRGVLVAAVTALIVDRLGQDVPTALLVALAAVALTGDFVDGQVARRTGTATAFGARFDMEVDAFLILALSVQVSLTHGPWVLVIGGIRYAFVAASWWLTWLRAPLPHSMARKVVAAVQGVVLTIAAAGIVPLSGLLVELALLSLLWSFGRDTAWLWRRAVATLEGSTSHV
ncbi:phosphatidylglycerophosphate synthase [Crossiella equi]|uniref:Phosphatidylglycerophosphate synthase n=1 Tax=Crossiella equi TaxID=130796 RepID=A0ABS5ASR1_9PSEU|nr:CDP-alcohol phosphatidyltransferase family protein [Crossiella equi]MBP2478720.1 phosphatidylglycerophosphate synthase [Crossiella equi]